MKILVVNSGSSSMKYQLIDMSDESIIAKGVVDRIGENLSNFEHKVNGNKYSYQRKIAEHTQALKWIFEVFVESENPVLKSISEIKAVGHRIVHGGSSFNDSILITEETLKEIEKNIELAPLHMPANIACVRACMKLLEVPMVAVFDNSFHLSMPDYAFMYGIKYEDYKDFGLRRYGFHGTSHRYLSNYVREKINKNYSKIITCHLGNGGSLAAVKDGKCIDTTMGFTPLEGLMMGTRSGDIDPAVVPFLMDKKNLSVEETINYLNKECGYLGITGFSSDSRDLWRVIKGSEDNEKKKRAQLAIDMYTYRIAKYIGGYTVALNGLDCIVFSGGIGENSPDTRRTLLGKLKYLGVECDIEENIRLNRKYGKISSENSKVAVYIIPTDEEIVIARDTLRLIK